MRACYAIPLVAVLLLCLVRIVRQDDHGPEPAADRTVDGALRPADPQPAVEGLVAPAGSATETRLDAASPAERARVRVRSSAEIVLSEVEGIAEDGTVERLPLEDGELPLAGASPRAVRAAGHRESELAPAAREIVLEPDALLELVAPDIEHVLSSVRPSFHSDLDADRSTDEERFARSAVIGRPASDRIAVALTSDRSRLLEGGVARIALTWADGRGAILELEPRPGLRARWDVPLEAGPPARDLAIEVIGPGGGAVERVSALITRAGGPNDEIDRRPEIVLPWGRVHFGAAIDGFRHRIVRLDQGRMSIAHLPLALHYRLSVVDESTGAFGAIEFEHDGSARRVELFPPSEVIVRVVVPEGELVPRDAQAGWTRSSGDVNQRPEWSSTEAHRAPITDGRMRLVGPASFKGRGDEEPPPRLHVHVRAKGFRFWQQALDVGNARVVEVVAELVPLPSDLVLAPGHRFTSDAPPTAGSFGPEHASHGYEAAIEGVRDRSDGSLVVSLQRAEADGSIRAEVRAAGKQGDIPALDPASLASCILDGGRAFVRGADGLFVSVDSRTHRVTIECRAPTPEGGPWTVGWQWRGLPWTPRETLRVKPGITAVEFVAPVDARLWWGPNFVPDPDPATGTGGFLPLASESVRVSVP